MVCVIIPSLTKNVGDIINILDIVNLGTLSLSDVYVSLLVTTHTANLTIPDDGDSHIPSDLAHSNQSSTVAYINQVRGDQIGDVGVANDGNFNNPKIKFNTVGTYDLTVHTLTFNEYVTVRINVQKRAYTIQFKTAPTPSLGSIGSTSTDNKVTLTYKKSDISIKDNFDVYDGGVKVTDSTLLNYVYDRITEVKFKLMKDNVPLKVGGEFSIKDSGTYQLNLFNFTSELLLVNFSKISFSVADVSYANVRFAEPVNITFGSNVPKIFSYLTTDTLGTASPTRLTGSDISSSYTLQLEDPSDSSTISQQNIPITEPGTYLLKALFGSNTVTGLLNISKAKVNIRNTLSKFYKVSTGSLNLADLFYVETLNGVKKPNEILTFSSKFITLTDTTTVSTSSTFTITEDGTLEVTATYSGNDSYIPSTGYQTTTIGKIPLTMAISKSYILAPTDLTSTKKTQIESEIVNILSVTNSITTDNTSSDITTLLKSKLSVKYRASVTESRSFSLKYTLSEGGVEGDIVTTTITDTFLNISDFIDPLENNTKTLSIKGIKVLDGTTLTLNYSKTVESVKTYSNITLTSNDDYYKIDDTTDTTTTYINITDGGSPLSLATNELTYIETSSTDYSKLENLSEGLFKVILTVDNSNNDFDEYSIVQTITENILVTTNLAVTIDLLNYLVDRINSSDRDIDYLLEKPQLNFDITSSVNDYTIIGTYLTATFTTTSVTTPTSIPTSFLTYVKVQPDFTYVAQNVSNNSVDLPFTTSTTGLLVYNGTTKLDVTSTFKLGLPNMVINNETVNMEKWLTDNSITINVPSGLSVGDSVATMVQNIDNNIIPIISAFERIEEIVLDPDHTDPSRPFWIGLINKLTVLRSKLETQIRANPSSFLFNDDISDLNEYSGLNVTLDLSTFDQADLNFLTSNSDIYSKLIQNEINTIILRKHLLTSITILKHSLLDKLTLNYVTGDKTFTTPINDGSMTVSIPSFSGTYGEITMSMTVNITNTQSSFGTVNYLNPYRVVSYGSLTDGTGKYTDINNTSSTVVIDSKTSSKTSGTHAINGSITLKGSDGIIISGLTRPKILEERINRNKFISSTTQEGITGVATITLEQKSRID
jgi:hypothetical protein